MKRTISIKLGTEPEQNIALTNLQREFVKICNKIATLAKEHRCWNKVALQRLLYSSIRSSTVLGSQAALKAIAAVCNTYKVLKIKKQDDVPLIDFKSYGSIHFDKRIYSLKNNALFLLRHSQVES